VVGHVVGIREIFVRWGLRVTVLPGANQGAVQREDMRVERLGRYCTCFSRHRVLRPNRQRLQAPHGLLGTTRHSHPQERLSFMSFWLFGEQAIDLICSVNPSAGSSIAVDARENSNGICGCSPRIRRGHQRTATSMYRRWVSSAFASLGF